MKRLQKTSGFGLLKRMVSHFYFMVSKIRVFEYHFFQVSQNSNPKVTLKQGTIVGTQGVLPGGGGGEFYSFKGIPYAVPPLGNLRFEPPVPLERFSENELDCTKERLVDHHHWMRVIYT